MLGASAPHDLNSRVYGTVTAIIIFILILITTIIIIIVSISYWRASSRFKGSHVTSQIKSQLYGSAEFVTHVHSGMSQGFLSVYFYIFIYFLILTSLLEWCMDGKDLGLTYTCNNVQRVQRKVGNIKPCVEIFCD